MRTARPLGGGAADTAVHEVEGADQHFRLPPGTELERVGTAIANRALLDSRLAVQVTATPTRHAPPFVGATPAVYLLRGDIMGATLDTTLDGGGATRHFYVEGTLILEDMILANGWADPSGTGTFPNTVGGAVFLATGAKGNFTRTTFTSNSARMSGWANDPRWGSSILWLLSARAGAAVASRESDRLSLGPQWCLGVLFGCFCLGKRLALGRGHLERTWAA